MKQEKMAKVKEMFDLEEVLLKSIQTEICSTNAKK